VPIPARQKRPLLRDWTSLRLTEADLPAHFSKEVNIGVILGDSSAGLVDVDLDCRQALALADYFLPRTQSVFGRTSKPRAHRFYNCTPAPPPRKFTAPDGECLLELRSTGQQTVVPPSVHPSGEAIAWETNGEPAHVGGPELTWRIAHVAAAALLARRWPGQGRRHESALALAGMLLGAGWSANQARDFVFAVALAAGDEEAQSRVRDVDTTAERLASGSTATGGPTLAEIIGDDAVRVAREWLKLPKGSGEAEKLDRALTDVGNAKRFAQANGRDVHFCHAWRKWFVWDGRRWALDDTGEIRRRAKLTARHILSEAEAETDDGKRKQILAWQRASESEHRIRAQISLAESELGIPIVVPDLDRELMLFNCANGTLDLAAGKFRKARRSDLITKSAPVPFDENAGCPRWLEFLDCIMVGNRKLIDFLQRIAGYALTGETVEHALFLFYGVGLNGKTTLLETLRYVWGDYAMGADFSSFVATKGAAVRNDLARLVGARIVTAVESQAHRRLAEDVIKLITGGDTVTARFLYAEHFEYKPEFKLLLATNHKPRIRGTDPAIWRRIKLVPFTVTIPEDKQDKALKEKLRAEAPGIMRWAFEGLFAWKRHGLAAPAEVTDATQEYRTEQDVLAQFIDECLVAEPESETSAADLYIAYRAWSERMGEYALSQKDLGLALKERGFQSNRSNKRRSWKGVRLLSPDGTDQLR
jgi:putative DNA primase/helicase